MRTLTGALSVEQKIDNRPVLKIEIQEYGHPAVSESVRPGDYNWEKMYEDDSQQLPSSVVFAGDGSLNRVRARYIGTNPTGHYVIEHQRIEAPDDESDYETWSTLYTINVGIQTPPLLTICANGAEVIVFTVGYDALAQPTAWPVLRIESDDYGETWDSPIDDWIMKNDTWEGYDYDGVEDHGFPRCGAAAYRSNGDIGFTFATVAYLQGAGTDLHMVERIDDVWQDDVCWRHKEFPLYVNPSSDDCNGMGIYRAPLDDQWNIIYAMKSFQKDTVFPYVITYTTASGYSGGYDPINLISQATDNLETTISRPMDWETPYEIQFQAIQRYMETRQTLPASSSGLLGGPYGLSCGGGSGPTMQVPRFQYAQLISPKYRGVLEMMKTVDTSWIGEFPGPHVIAPSTCQPIMSLYIPEDMHFFQLRKELDFADNKWVSIGGIHAISLYALAFAVDDTYIWASASNQLWRMQIPEDWEPPTVGAGAGDKITLTNTDIKLFRTIDNDGQQALRLELDNSAGTYDSPGSGNLALLQHGSRINVFEGMNIEGTPVYSEAQRYFVERYGYGRLPGEARFYIEAVGAWELLRKYIFPCPVQWNKYADHDTMFEIIEQLVQTIGGTLDYISRSTLMTTLYPNVEIQAGENAATVLKRVLVRVPDVIYFFGVDGYIVYPFTTDDEVYTYVFPSP